MPSNLVPPLTQPELKQLHKLLNKYKRYVNGEQPLAGDILHQIMEWIRSDIEPKDGENSYNPRY